jgi:uncharacterized damage-inducible protein DinB
MRIELIHPYWADLRLEIVDFVTELTAEQWTARFGRRTTYSAEQIIFRVTELERWWIGHVCQSLPWDEIRPQMKRDRTQAIEQLRATFELTNRYIDTLEPESLRFVRTVPPDIQANRPEENRRIDWIIWEVVTLEITALAQIEMMSRL